jgi:hypothetical protein
MSDLVDEASPPSEVGWYPSLKSWDSAEGWFPGAHFWDGARWHKPDRAGFIYWPVKLADADTAKDYAYAHDPEW